MTIWLGIKQYIYIAHILFTLLSGEEKVTFTFLNKGRKLIKSLAAQSTSGNNKVQVSGRMASPHCTRPCMYLG